MAMGSEAKETTISEEVLSLKSGLVELQGALRGFLHQSGHAKGVPTPTIADPLGEVIANLQDCRRLVSDIRQLAIDKIAKRISP